MAFPTIAERARTTAASAAAADLITYAPRPGGPSSVTVPVDADHRGRPLLSVGANSPAAARLLARPLATVILAAPACAPVVVHGGAHRVRGARRHRVLAFRLEVAGVRVILGGGKGTLVGPDEYEAAEPDPLRDAAPGVLAHLACAHPAELGACVRAHGLPGVEFVEPRCLDRHGLELLAVSERGATTIRLPFPAPVTHLTELSPGVAGPLLCRCDTDRVGLSPRVRARAASPVQAGADGQRPERENRPHGVRGARP